MFEKRGMKENELDTCRSAGKPLSVKFVKVRDMGHDIYILAVLRGKQVGQNMYRECWKWRLGS